MVTTQLKPKNEGEALKVAKVVLKRRDRNLVANAERAKTIQSIRRMRKSKPKLIEAVQGNALLKKCKQRAMDKEHLIISKMKRFLERKIPQDAKCLLVARNARVPESGRTKEALIKLDLLANNRCRIIATTKSNIDTLRICDAYVYYGVPTPETVSTLVHKKAYVPSPESSKEMNGKKSSPIALNNNAIVEDILGQYGLICVEDLVEVLLKGRDNEELFDKVSKFILSFKVNPESNKPGSMFKNSRATRGFVPKIDTIMARLV
jgi:large subunit ribosomal protein L7e